MTRPNTLKSSQIILTCPAKRLCQSMYNAWGCMMDLFKCSITDICSQFQLKWLSLVIHHHPFTFPTQLRKFWYIDYRDFALGDIRLICNGGCHAEAFVCHNNVAFDWLDEKCDSFLHFFDCSWYSFSSLLVVHACTLSFDSTIFDSFPRNVLAICVIVFLCLHHWDMVKGSLFQYSMKQLYEAQ